jgi:hypothetical protein
MTRRLIGQQKILPVSCAIVAFGRIGHFCHDAGESKQNRSVCLYSDSADCDNQVSRYLLSSSPWVVLPGCLGDNGLQVPDCYDEVDRRA